MKTTTTFDGVEAVLLWAEDDCTGGLPGHEYLGDAWKRLFGTEYDKAKAARVVDGGDHIVRYMPDGIIVLVDCCGDYIYRVKEITQ